MAVDAIQTPPVREQIADIVQWAQVTMPASANNSIWNAELHRQTVARDYCVLTGAPCSGKTTTLRSISEKGFRIVPEYIRELSEAANREIDPKDVKGNVDILVETAAAHHLQEIYTDVQSGNQDRLFFDRGLGDAIGMLSALKIALGTPIVKTIAPLVLRGKGYNVESLEVADINRQIAHLKGWSEIVKYRQVLWLEPLPIFEADDIRPSNRIAQHVLKTSIWNAWKDLGYTPIKIPPLWGDVEGRAKRVLAATE